LLTDKKVTTGLPGEASSRQFRVTKLVSGLGLALLLGFTLAWILTFPTVPLIQASLSGERLIPEANRQATGIAVFFRRYPQLLWLGFALGAGLFFGFRTKQGQPEPEELFSKNSPFELAGLRRVIPGWVNTLWRFGGIIVLGLILLVATNLRIGEARQIGLTDLVAADYDESVYATTALMLAQGKSLYRDFYSSQPPLGFLLWSLPLRQGRAEWGGLEDFLRLRLFTSLLSLVTIALVYLTGRMLGGRWAGPIAGSVAALALAIDGGAVRIDQQVMLEPLINLFTAAAICAFVHYQPAKRTVQGWPWLFPLLAGSFVGLALSVKLAALGVLVGLGLTLFIWRRWQALGMLGFGTIISFSLVNGYFLLTNGSDYVKQNLLYQFMRPAYRLAVFGEFSSETSLTAFDFLSSKPYLAFTLLAAVFGLAAIVLRWLTRTGGENWLPIVLTAVFTTYLYTGKAGFFPHYYAQMALPLALLGGGIVNFWQREWWSKRMAAGLSLAGIIVVGFLLWPALKLAGDEPSKPVWSWERAADRTFDNAAIKRGSIFTADLRYSFIMGLPLPTDSYGKYWVENSAYTEYLALGFQEQSLVEVARKALLAKKLTTEEFSQLHYAAIVQDNFLQTARKADYFLLEAGAASQLTAESGQALKRDFISQAKSSQFEILGNGRRAAQYPSGALYGGKMRLVGFDTPSQFRPGSGTNKLPLKLLWRGEEPMSEDYIIFFHLLNQAGETVAQRDTAPRYGALNTSKWIPGEILDDDQSLDLPPDLPAGEYKIEIGVYRPADGQRLNLSEVSPPQQITPDGNSLILLEVNFSR